MTSMTIALQVATLAAALWIGATLQRIRADDGVRKARPVEVTVQEDGRVADALLEIQADVAAVSDDLQAIKKDSQRVLRWIENAEAEKVRRRVLGE